MIKRIRLNKKKGFTLIELIVVMAVVGVLVLLAVPRFIGQAEKAKLTQIQNDIRVVEGKLNEVLVGKPDTLKTWEPAEAAELTELVSENKLVGRGGPTLGLPTGDVWVIDDAFLDTEVRTKLNGDFFVDADGNVFYEHSKPVAPGKTETPPEKEEKPLTYEEWLAKVQAEGYVLATDADFKLSKTSVFSGVEYFTYVGTDDYIIIPETIQGKVLTNYMYMFHGPGTIYTPSSTTVKGVASNNPNVTSFKGMFQYSTLSSLDLTHLDTSQVTDMYDMFNEAKKLTELDVSGFDTSNVTNMYRMFAHNSSLVTLDLSGFDTSNVTDMRDMFLGNAKLTSLDVSSFDTSNITELRFMFRGLDLPELDLSGFDTSNLKVLDGTFSNSKIGTLDLSSFDFSKLKGVMNIFENATINTIHTGTGADTDILMKTYKRLSPTKFIAKNGEQPSEPVYSDAFHAWAETLPPHYVIAKESDFVPKKTGSLNPAEYFTYVGNDEYIIIPETIQGEKLTNYKYMFHGPGTIYTPSSTTVKGVASNNPNVTSFEGMFQYSTLSSLDLTHLDTSQVTKMYSMFNEAKKLTELDVSGFDTSNVTNMYEMFAYNSSLVTLDLSGFDTSNVTDMRDMFNGSAKLTSLDVSSFDTSNITELRFMFRGLTMPVLDISSFNLANIKEVKSPFERATIKTVYVKSQKDLDILASQTNIPTTLQIVIKPTN